MITEPGGRRGERAQVESGDPGSSPVYAPAALPLYGFWFTSNEEDPRYTLHRIRGWVNNVYLARCGKPSYALPKKVPPTSPWLVPCEICFPGGVIG